ncbi:hypothetical protein CGMCC3_g16772 [Colletotrichum fructicola]|nr:uncharacterized protein CGMCC3_g16772 [Colletotrichum fructicola]KAE9567076.1 hypothetical protein CGMCC3_g16772 [Colletotrichum fructicola]
MNSIKSIFHLPLVSWLLYLSIFTLTLTFTIILTLTLILTCMKKFMTAMRTEPGPSSSRNMTGENLQGTVSTSPVTQIQAEVKIKNQLQPWEKTKTQIPRFMPRFQGNAGAERHLDPRPKPRGLHELGVPRFMVMHESISRGLR